MVTKVDGGEGGVLGQVGGSGKLSPSQSDGTQIQGGGGAGG